MTDYTGKGGYYEEPIKTIKTDECPAVVAVKAHAAGQLENYAINMLKKTGWSVGGTQKFLKLSDEEMTIIREAEEKIEYVNGVHDKHCCKKHGCKYFDPECPVEFGSLLGIYCEDCENLSVEEQINDLRDGLKRMSEELEEIKRML